MQDIRERVRQKDPNANKRICFEVRATALRPHLHTEGFQLSTIGSSTHRPPLRNYNLTPEYTTLPLKHIHFYIRGKEQSLAQSKEEIKLRDPMTTNSLMVISKDHK